MGVCICALDGGIVGSDVEGVKWMCFGICARFWLRQIKFEVGAGLDWASPGKKDVMAYGFILVCS